MTTATMPAGQDRAVTLALLSCGVFYALAYVLLNDVVAAALYPGYDRVDQAVSELSSTEAPSKRFLQAMLPVFTFLLAGFATGIWRAAAGQRALRATAVLVFASTVVGVAWLFFPMTSREAMTAGAPMRSNDVGHLVLSGLTVSLILAEMALSAVALGRWFRLLTAVAAGALLTFGVLMSRLAPHAAEGHTPLMGLYERAMLAGWLVWMATFALALMRRHRKAQPLA